MRERLLASFIAVVLSSASAQAAGLDDANAGLVALNRGDSAAAITLFSETISSGQLSPADLELAYVDRAKAYIANGQSNRATSDLDQAQRLDPTDQEIAGLRSQTVQSSQIPTPDAAAPLPEILRKAKTAFNNKDYTQAMLWYREAADQGSAEAQMYIGAFYQNGWGVPENDAQAMQWFRKAADQGYAEAQILVGSLYQLGLIVPMDYAQAMQWFRKAADQGNADAQWFVGHLYEFGNGVPEDVNQARYWYGLAAKQGDEQARKSLDQLK